MHLKSANPENSLDSWAPGGISVGVPATAAMPVANSSVFSCNFAHFRWKMGGMCHIFQSGNLQVFFAVRNVFASAPRLSGSPFLPEMPNSRLIPDFFFISPQLPAAAPE